jgi:hypothetical protein
MQKTLTIAGLALAIAAAAPALAQVEYYSTLNYYTQTLKAARERCKGDNVVWLNTKTGQYSQLGQNDYGTTEQGRYVCESEARKSGTPQQVPVPPPH